MSLATRLRLQGGSGAHPATRIAALTSAGNGGWNQQSDPKAAQHNGYVYVAWLDSSGNVEVAAVNDATRAVSATVTLHATLPVDLHTSPSLLVRSSDHKLLAFYSEHNGAAMYMRVSTTSLDTDPTLADGFAAEVNLDSQIGGTAYTYPTILERADGTLILWFRDLVTGVAYLAYSYSTDDGATWATKAHMMTVGGAYIYFKVSCSGNRQDLVVSDGHPVSDAPTKLYHLYSDLTDWYTSAGTVISAGWPLAPTDGTEVYDGADGSGWVMGVEAAGGTTPAAVYWAGTYGQGDMDIRYARWSGSAWVEHTVANIGGGVSSYYAPGGAIIDEADLDVVYLARFVAGTLEPHRYETADGGATWTALQLTSGSAADAWWPAKVADRATGLRAVWLRGTVSAEDTFSAAVEATWH